MIQLALSNLRNLVPFYNNESCDAQTTKELAKLVEMQKLSFIFTTALLQF